MRDGRYACCYGCLDAVCEPGPEQLGPGAVFMLSSSCLMLVEAFQPKFFKVDCVECMLFLSCSAFHWRRVCLFHTDLVRCFVKYMLQELPPGATCF
jgi:hypothetical protein